LVPAVVGKLHELSTNDQTVRDPRSSKGTAAVVFFPAHMADHGGLSSAEIKSELARLSDMGTIKAFREFSELHQTVLHVQCRGLPTNIPTAQKRIRARTLAQRTGGF
jgi:hypothetical protein